MKLFDVGSGYHHVRLCKFEGDRTLLTESYTDCVSSSFNKAKKLAIKKQKRIIEEAQRQLLKLESMEEENCDTIENPYYVQHPRVLEYGKQVCIETDKERT